MVIRRRGPWLLAEARGTSTDKCGYTGPAPGGTLPRCWHTESGLAATGESDREAAVTPDLELVTDGPLYLGPYLRERRATFDEWWAWVCAAGIGMEWLRWQ